MPKLPKVDIPGHAHFVTAKINRFIPLFAAHEFCRMLLANFDFYRRKHDFKLLGYVLILDHFHAIIYPQHEVPISKILQNIKGYTAKQILDRLRECPTSWDELGGLVVSPEQLEVARQTPAERCLRNLRVPTLADFRVTKPRTRGQVHQVWQEGFYDFNIYTEWKLREKLNYMHKNPVDWGLVDDPGDYVYSSCRNFYDEDSVLPIEVDWV